MNDNKNKSYKIDSKPNNDNQKSAIEFDKYDSEIQKFNFEKCVFITGLARSGTTILLTSSALYINNSLGLMLTKDIECYSSNI